MLFPAISARKAVRLGCAKTLTSLSNIYASLMAAWITDTPTSKELKSGSSAWARSFRNELSTVALQLRDLKETAGSAKWEGNVRGHWPHEEYNRMIDVQQEMISVLSQVSQASIGARTFEILEKLAGALLELDDEWRSDFLHHTKVVNPNFVRTYSLCFVGKLIFLPDLRRSLRLLARGPVSPYWRANAHRASAKLA